MAIRLTSIIITKNEEKMIKDCLVSLQFSDEILVVDTGNTDRTNEIAKAYKARIVVSGGKDYSQFRNDGLKVAKGDWVLYIDADERVTPLLRKEIEMEIGKSDSASAYAVPRQNFYLGREMEYGGWGEDYVVRLFKRQDLEKWENELHEQPKFSGQMRKLENKLVHFSHRDLTSMLAKTLTFTEYEAKLRLDQQHPMMVPWRFGRVMITEFWYRFVKLGAWMDGTEGIIDGLFQVFNTFVIYAKVWEKQAKANK